MADFKRNRPEENCVLKKGNAGPQVLVPGKQRYDRHLTGSYMVLMADNR
jgi:hypothetical protein